MTDSEKLDLLLEKVIGIEGNVSKVRICRKNQLI